MPFKYIAAVMFGNGLSGISMNLLRAFLQAILPSDELFVMALVFSIGAGSILGFAAFIFDPVFKNEFFQYYLTKSQGEAHGAQCAEREEGD